MCIYIYVYVYMYVYILLYIYIYIYVHLRVGVYTSAGKVGVLCTPIHVCDMTCPCV